MSTQSESSRNGHAIVIGGSMAGLWTARVLADHFDRVTVVERDQLPAGPAIRKGVPQARHIHILLVRGMRVLEQLFPGLEAELAAAGAPRVDWLRDSRTLTATGWLKRFPSDVVTHTCSRAMLEWSIRRRLLANRRIAFLPECDAVGLLAEGGGDRVNGVLIRRRAGNQLGTPEPLRADLTVDASGRDSKTPEWLRGAGYGEAEETVINSFVGYATRWYRKPAGFAGDWKALFIGSRPPHGTRGGIIFPVEDDTWAVTITGYARDYPPQDEAGYLAFARSLPAPDLYEAIKDAEPLTPIHGYRRTENRLRHYERLPRWPKGFAALGDAVCAFNPVYGQGMTASASAALALDGTLRAARGDLTAATGRFQRDLARVNNVPWTLATSEDFRWPTTIGGAPARLTRFMHGYMNRVIPLVREYRPVARTFIEVLHLVAPPVALFKPAVVAPVLWHAIRGDNDQGATRGQVAPA